MLGLQGYARACNYYEPMTELTIFMLVERLTASGKNERGPAWQYGDTRYTCRLAFFFEGEDIARRAISRSVRIYVMYNICWQNKCTTLEKAYLHLFHHDYTATHHLFPQDKDPWQSSP